MNDGLTLTFHCRTVSPLHTTRQQYSNLIKCAPHIMGSTLRGAIVARLIEREVCPKPHAEWANASRETARVGELHRACENPACPIAPFFPAPNDSPSAWFSFGTFDAPEPARLYRAATRIALERATGSVAEGAIITIESIAPDTPFAFNVTLFGDAARLADDIEWAVRMTAQTQGLGRFRSIGYGQFELSAPPARIAFAEGVEKTREQWNASRELQAEFATPFIIGKGDGQVAALDRRAFREWLQKPADATLRAIGMEAELALTDAALTLTPEYVSRFSYEMGGPQHRLVAWKGSRLKMTLARDDDETTRALAALSLLGMGEWSDCGFGQIAKPKE